MQAVNAGKLRVLKSILVLETNMLVYVMNWWASTMS